RGRRQSRSRTRARSGAPTAWLPSRCWRGPRPPARARWPGRAPSSGLREPRGVGAHLARRLRDLVHVAARTEQHRLPEPHRLAAEPVVLRALAPLAPVRERALAVDPPEAAAGERVLEEGLLVQR